MLASPKEEVGDRMIETNKQIIPKGLIGKFVLEYMFIEYIGDWWWWIEFADVSRN